MAQNDRAAIIQMPSAILRDHHLTIQRRGDGMTRSGKGINGKMHSATVAGFPGAKPKGLVRIDQARLMVIAKPDFPIAIKLFAHPRGFFDW